MRCKYFSHTTFANFILFFFLKSLLKTSHLQTMKEKDLSSKKTTEEGWRYHSMRGKQTAVEGKALLLGYIWTSFALPLDLAWALASSTS